MDKNAAKWAVVHGVAESDVTEVINAFTFRLGATPMTSVIS